VKNVALCLECGAKLQSSIRVQCEGLVTPINVVLLAVVFFVSSNFRQRSIGGEVIGFTTNSLDCAERALIRTTQSVNDSNIAQRLTRARGKQIYLWKGNIINWNVRIP